MQVLPELKPTIVYPIAFATQDYNYYKGSYLRYTYNFDGQIAWAERRK